MKIQETVISKEVFEFLNQIDTKTLIKEYLRETQFKINGYRDHDVIYEEISFDRRINPNNIDITICDQSLKFSICDDENQIRLYVTANLLVSSSSIGSNIDDIDDIELAELSLIFNDKGEFIDENWLINTDSPFVKKKLLIES